jgi:hypothetical protein
MTRLLALLLMVYEPLHLALTASTLLPGLPDRSWAATALLVARLAITGFGFAVGRGLWERQPGALPLARWVTGLNLATTVLVTTTSIWPTSLPPGVREPAALVAISWYAGWFVWTLRRAAVDQRTDA